MILAAGGSRRMGQPKALLPWGDRTLLESHISALAEVAREVVVVEGAVHFPELPVETIANVDWESTWPADSLFLALRARPAAASVFVTPVDTIPATREILHALLGGETAVPVDPSGTPGHPVMLSGPELALARAAAPEGGLRALLGAARRVRVSARWVSLDFNDPQSLAMARRAAIED